MASKHMGVRIIIINERGEVMACLSSSSHFHFQPIIVKTYALMRVVQLCQELGMQMIEFEGDALVLI